MKHARVRFEDQVHLVHVEARNAVRLSDGRLLAEDQVVWLPPATGTMFHLAPGRCGLHALRVRTGGRYRQARP